MRRVAAFLLAIVIATSVTGFLIGLPLSLFPPITLEIFVVAIAQGTLPAGILLTISFSIASRCSESRIAMAVAGGFSGLAFAILSLGLRWSGYRPWAATFLVDTHSGAETFVRIGMSAMIAGLLSGWVFSKVQSSDPTTVRKSHGSYPALIVLLVGSLPLLLAAWYAMHDRGGDVLCAHTDIVRVRVGETVYEIPAVYQANVNFPREVDDRGKVFERHMWNGTEAARQAPYELTYCQTDHDAPWRVSSFSIFSMHARSLLPYQVGDVEVREHKFVPSDYGYSESAPISLPVNDPELRFLTPDREVRLMPVVSGSAQYVYADTTDDTSVQVWLFTNNGFSAVDALHAAGRLLRALHPKVAGSIAGYKKVGQVVPETSAPGKTGHSR